jgi:hypothetical protein
MTLSAHAVRTNPFFQAATAKGLSRGNIESVAAGTVGALRLPNFLSAAECAVHTAALQPARLTPYNPTRYDPVTRLGPAINEYNTDGLLPEAYWSQAESATRYWQRNRREDLRANCLARFRDAWGGHAGPARTSGRELFWGMVREVNSGMRPHWDEVVREFPHDFMDARPVVQMAFNVYLSMPDTGGETLIWPRRWQPADEDHRKGFAYGSAMVFNEDPLVVGSRTGDALLFDPRNYHAVNEGDESGRRISLAFFVGLTSWGGLIVWS